MKKESRKGTCSIDLHCHSNMSDGTDTPEQLISLAKTMKIKVLSLTDHDNVDGIQRVMDAGHAYGIRVISGVELGASCSSGSLHLLGYGINIHEPQLLTHLTKMQERRKHRNSQIFKKIEKFGINLLPEDLFVHRPANQISRIHFAHLLVQKGVAVNLEIAFQMFLAEGMPFYIKKEDLSSLDCISLIHEAGGVAVLAHYHTIKLDQFAFLELLNQLIDFGLDGLECFYPEYTHEQTEWLLNIAEEKGLLVTAGSDYHGLHKPTVQLGIIPPMQNWIATEVSPFVELMTQ